MSAISHPSTLWHIWRYVTPSIFLPKILPVGRQGRPLHNGHLPVSLPSLFQYLIHTGKVRESLIIFSSSYSEYKEHNLFAIVISITMVVAYTGNLCIQETGGDFLPGL